MYSWNKTGNFKLFWFLPSLRYLIYFWSQGRIPAYCLSRKICSRKWPDCWLNMSVPFHKTHTLIKQNFRLCSDGCSVLYKETQARIKSSKSSSSVPYKPERCNRSCPVRTSYVRHTLQMSSNCTEFLSVTNCITQSELSFFVLFKCEFRSRTEHEGQDSEKSYSSTLSLT